MVTTVPTRPTSPMFSAFTWLASAPLAFSWRLSEAFWPRLPAACGLDAEAAPLLRAGLTLAVERMLKARRTGTLPLPAPCSLRRVRQRRFDPAVVHWERRDELQALLQEEVRLTLALVQRPLGGGLSAQWASLLVQQCERIGCLYQALARRVGRDLALTDLAVALERVSVALVS